MSKKLLTVLPIPFVPLSRMGVDGLEAFKELEKAYEGWLVKSHTHAQPPPKTSLPDQRRKAHDELLELEKKLAEWLDKFGDAAEEVLQNRLREHVRKTCE
jgi:hypothetical protein